MHIDRYWGWKGALPSPSQDKGTIENPPTRIDCCYGGQPWREERVAIVEDETERPKFGLPPKQPQSSSVADNSDLDLNK